MSRRAQFAAIALAAIVFAALAGCRAPAAGDALVAEPRPLSIEEPARARLGAAEVLSVHQLRSKRQWFGGISGLSYDGRTVTAINDAGHWLRFAMAVDDAGRPVSFGDLEVAPLGGLDGSKEDGDAEEVTALPEGWLVSFERRHRLLLYRHGLSAAPEPQALPEGYGRQPENGGVEAVARLADNRLLLLSEEGVDEDGLGWAWIGWPGEWRRLSWRRDGLFRPTAMTQLPDGDLLVLERGFSLLGGFVARLVRVPAAGLRPGAVLEGSPVLTLAPPLPVDNYEGMAVLPRKDGRLIAYLVVDDNFSLFQDTLLMAVLLPR